MARRNFLGAMIVAASVACGSTQVTGDSTGTTTGSSLASLPSGAPCSSNDQCFSTHCGLDGTGNCCESACTTDGTACGIAACDEKGACIKAYAGTSCDSCSGSTLTEGACNGSGTCEPGIPTPCPDSMKCNSAGTACASTCASTKDCGTGFYCSEAGICAAALAIGACTGNDQCASGVCGVNGSGHCCAAACSNTTAPCGATDCAGLTGDCIFPPATTACGAASSCSGSTQTNATLCDGMGTCPAAATTDCTPFICGPTACLSTCSDANSCASGDFCDLTGSACCAPLTSGATLTVDGQAGSDGIGCCGIGTNRPCQTVTHAMQLIDSTQAQNVTIVATLGDGGGDWAPPGEKYPIVLGWGVELKAPGIYFWDPNGTGSPGTFLINAYSAADTLGYASIVGTAAHQIGIGMNKSGGMQSTAYAAVQIDPDQTLFIANAYVNGNATAQTNAFTVMPGATLMFGQDKSGAVAGTVNIGNGNNNQPTDGYDGIYCRTDNSGRGCTVVDTAMGGQNSVIIQGQEAGDIIALDFASITLTSSPIFGVNPGDIGFGQCSWKPDAASLKYSPSAAIYLSGKSSLTLKHAAIHCISGDGIAMVASSHGTPTLDLEDSNIRNTEAALQVNAGVANVWNSVIEFNYNGVIQAAGQFGAPGGSVNLNGGLDGGTDGGTTVICSSATESIYSVSGLVGVAVENQSSGVLNAQNVCWDTPEPDQFHCKTNLASCYCALDAGTCLLTAGYDGMDAVTENGPVIVTGNTRSALAAQRGCQ